MYAEISVHTLKGWIGSDKDFQLIDVREQGEYDEGHIEGAKLIPLGQLRARINEIEKQMPAVFVCRSGQRSGMACKIADVMGFSHSYNLTGGMTAWHNSH